MSAVVELKRLESQLANVRAGRISNELRVEELKSHIEQLEADIKISLEK